MGSRSSPFRSRRYCYKRIIRFRGLAGCGMSYPCSTIASMVVSVRRSAALLLAVVLASALPACSKSEKPDASLKAFLTAWEQGKLDGQTLLAPDGQTLSGADAQKILTTVEGDLAARRPKLTLKTAPAAKKDDASAPVEVAWPIADNVTWTYDTTVSLHRKDDKWRVVFSAKTVNQELTASDKLTVKRTTAQRGGMLDGSGNPLVTNRPVVVIGVQPRSISDIGTVQKNLTDALAS